MMLYKRNGSTMIDGRMVDYQVFEDDQLDQAKKDGWLTHAEAWTDEVIDAPNDDAPVTRAELETKAKELGLKFDGRTGDAKLQKMIEAAL